MEIVIIGTGNAAWVLGRKLKEAGHEIVQIFGRDAKKASELAYELDTESTNYWSVVNRNADLYILAVSDIAVEEIMKELDLPDKTIVHTAASVSKEVLNNAAHYGVFYPLQTLRKEAKYFPEIPIIIDASDTETCQALVNLAETISSKITIADDVLRMKLHLAAVFVNNFSNHLYALAEQYCKREGIDFLMLLPLIKETALRVETISPTAAQTGPAVRNDTNTIEKHLSLLEHYPHLKNIYLLFTKSIQELQPIS